MPAAVRCWWSPTYHRSPPSADAQFFVEKLERQGRTLTRVTRLSTEDRELELARMLSGSITDASLANARELLAGTR